MCRSAQKTFASYETPQPHRMANLAAVQANLTLRKAGGMKQTKVSAARSVVANLAAVQANLTLRKAGGMKQTKASADPGILLLGDTKRSMG